MVKKTEVDSRKRALWCVNASLEKKAKGLVVLRVKEISDFADYFIICSGTSDRQVRAIASSIQESLKKSDILPLGIEGETAGRWVLMDYDDVIIHIFHESVRSFYELERLWSEAPQMAIPDETTSLKALPRGI
ncbi:MAG: ribosome silencing factor [Deltaproteobacteria bacterium]|nr:ribosome silencing factor [Deltaproteobacteria bacterium]